MYIKQTPTKAKKTSTLQPNCDFSRCHIDNRFFVSDQSHHVVYRALK